MEPFEYVMALISVVFGLGVTHVLGAVGEAVHRIRGYGPPIKFDVVYLLWMGFILLWFVLLWWAEYKFQQVAYVWTLGGYLLVISYVISLYLVAVILIPAQMGHVTDTYSYFVNGRRWFFGAVFVANFLDFFDSLMKGADWALRPESLVSQTGLIGASCVVGWFSTRRSIQITIAVLCFASQVMYFFQSMNTLGSW